MTKNICLLPKYLTLRIYVEWFTMKDLCLFDSAICSSKFRDDFLSSISTNCQVRGIRDQVVTRPYLLWLIERNLFVADVVLPSVTEFTEEDSVLNMIMILSPKIKYLKGRIDSEQFMLALQSILENAVELQEFHFPASPVSLDTTLNVLSKCSETISVLNLNHCNIKMESLSILIISCHNLTELHLDQCSRLTDELLTNLRVIRCAGLKELHFTQLTMLSSGALSSLLELCTSLRVLRVGHCNKATVDSAVMATVTTHCSKLEVLDVSGSTEVTAAQLETLLERCPLITDLTLSRCVNIQNIAFGSFKLTKIDLSLCTMLTDDDVMQLSVSCEQLESLSLYGCSLLTDHSVKLIVCNCYVLKVLNLGRCPLLTDDALITLAQCLGLQSLTISHCPNLTLSAVSYLVETCETLTTLEQRE